MRVAPLVSVGAEAGGTGAAEHAESSSERVTLACKLKQKGKTVVTNGEEVELKFTKLSEENCGEGSGQAKSAISRIGYFFSWVMIFEFKSPYAKVRVGSGNCVYNLKLIDVDGTVPGLSETAEVFGTGVLATKEAGCEEEYTFSGKAQWYNPGVVGEGPLYLDEE